MSNDEDPARRAKADRDQAELIERLADAKVKREAAYAAALDAAERAER